MNIQIPQQLSPLPVSQLVHPKPPAEEKALKDAKTTTHKLLGSGAVGSTGQKINSTVLNVEKVSKLSQGDVNAVNVKAAVDLGEKLTRGRVQQMLGSVAAPIGAVASVELMDTRIRETIDNPNADNFKLLFKTGHGAASSFSTLSKLLLTHSDDIARFAGKNSGSISRLLSRGVGGATKGWVKTGLTTSQKVLGHVGGALNVGVAGLDIYIAGKDIATFWKDPSGRNLAKMGLGLVAATGSVLAASKIPGLSGKGAIVAALADVGKVGMDVDWGTVATATKNTVVDYTTTTVKNYERELIVSRLPVEYLTAHPSQGAVGKTLQEQVNSWK